MLSGSEIMKKRGLIVSVVLHAAALAALAAGDEWYVQFTEYTQVLFWSSSLLSLCLMLACGLKNPGRLRKSEAREVVERLTQHVKNASNCSLDAILEHTAQIQPDSSAKPSESEPENPYARIEVELGSDSSRENRIAAEDNTKQPIQEVVILSSSQPTLPIKSEPVTVAPLQSEDKPFPEANPSPTRFCPVCSVDQILRAKHCNKCEVCVATYDHHCPWLSTCIGEKNRLLFVLFVTVLSVEVGIGLIHSLEMGFESVKGCIILVIMIVANVMVDLLYIHHIMLLWKNMTTWEFLARSHITYLKNWPSRWHSPFDRGIISTLRLFIKATSSRAPFIVWELPAPTKTRQDPVPT